MKLPAGRSALIIISIVVVLAALTAALLGIVFLNDRSPDPALAQSVQDEYSVPLYLKIVNISGKNEAYIVPGEVRWSSGHKKLLYNLSNPKETTLAFVEILANNDAEALYLILSQSTKDHWAGKGYSQVQVLEEYRSMNKDFKEPYKFELEQGEEDPSEGILSVLVTRDSDVMRFKINLESDGKWMI